MQTNTIVPVSRFETPLSPQAFMQNPASPMVMLKLLQLLEKMDQKMNELTIYHPQPLDTRAVEMMPARPIESRQVETKPTQSNPPAKQRRVRVNRSKLLDMFD